MSDISAIKVPFIRKDSIIDLKLGTVAIGNLQAILAYLLEGHSQEDIDKVSTAIAAGATLEPWALHAANLTQILSGILQASKDQDKVDYKDMSSILSGSV